VRCRSPTICASSASARPCCRRDPARDDRGYALFPWGGRVPAPALLLGRSGGDGCDLIVLGPLDPFLVRLSAAFVAGIVVGGPGPPLPALAVHHPRADTRERRYALPFVLLSQLMFAAGIVFAAWVIPRGLGILLELGGDSIRPLLGAREYLSFLLAMGLAFGVVFELPLVLVFLALAGVITSDGMRRFRRYAIVANVVAAAFITPTGDAVTLLLVAGPMIVFYELAIVFAWLIERGAATGDRGEDPLVPGSPRRASPACCGSTTRDVDARAC
jgi:sec-independent protein translocase protein TatC